MSTSGPDTSRTTHYAAFAGRRRRFRLRLGQIEELERLAKAGIGEIMLRLAQHRFRAADIRETVRLGLEGGGLDEPSATALVMYHVDEAPISDHFQLASDVLSSAVSGIPSDPENVVDERTSGPGDLSPFIAAGAAIGISADDIRNMTFADLSAAMKGYHDAHTPKGENAPSVDEAMTALAEEIAAGNRP